jgi:hypothetical protein
MATIDEAREEVRRRMRELVGLVDRASSQTASEVELALWTGVLGLGGAMMTLFLAHQAAKWPAGRRYRSGGVEVEVEGGEPRSRLAPGSGRSVQFSR